MGKSKIDWTDKVWNPVTGCDPIAAGCLNCYAKRMSQRLKGRCGYPADDPFRVTLHPDRLEQVLHWRKPRRVFVCSMADLFHESVPMAFIHKVFDYAQQAGLKCEGGHTFQFLTKRPARMRAAVNQWLDGGICGAGPFCSTVHEGRHQPPDYFWFGYSSSNQKDLEAGIEDFLWTPAAVHFLSLEPLVGPVSISRWLEIDRDIQTGETVFSGWRPELDWVIVGSESGNSRRPMPMGSVRKIRDQCIVAGVPFFLKQMERDGTIEKMPNLDGKIWAEMPEYRK